jgi:hypothetical protein
MVIAPSDVMLASHNNLAGAAANVPTLKSVDPANVAAQLGAHSDEHIGINAPPINGHKGHSGSADDVRKCGTCSTQA